MSILKRLRNVGLAGLILATTNAIPPATHTTTDLGEYVNQTAITQTYIKKKPVKITDRNFKKEVLQSKIPVMVDFYHPRCYYCRKAKPFIEEMASQYAVKIKIGTYDDSKNSLFSEIYEIEAYPTFIFYNKGKEVSRVVGFNKEAIKKHLERLLKKSK